MLSSNVIYLVRTSVMSLDPSKRFVELKVADFDDEGSFELFVH